MLDLVIKGGTIIDGTGRDRFVADIGIKGDTIYIIGRNLRGKKIIDASGLIVSPGFIDMHSHSDLTTVINRNFDSKIRQGITTEVIGNCGISISPNVNKKSLRFIQQWIRFSNGDISADLVKRSCRETFGLLEKRGILNNIIFMVGHGVLRAAVMDFEDRIPRKVELEKMKNLLKRAMREGAWGISSGLIYPPGCYSNTKELIELAKVASDFEGIYVSHIRGENAPSFNSIKEIVEIGKKADIKVHVSHIKCPGPRVWNKSKTVIDMLEKALQAGINITADVYPYTASSTFLFAVLPLWVYKDGKMIERLKDFSLRKIIVKEMLYSNSLIRGINFSNVYIAGSKNKDIVGENIEEIAKSRKSSAHDTIFDIIIEDPKSTMICHSMKENDLINFLKYRRVCIGTDGMALNTKMRRRLLRDKPHPRYFGTFPRVLNRYVKNKRILKLEEAIYKMTGLSSNILNLNNRGVVEEGKMADIVIFDSKKVEDISTFDNPFQYPKGIEYVILNGKLSLEKGRIKGFFGKVLWRKV